MHSTLQTLLHYFLVTICLALGFALLLIFRTAYTLLLVPLAQSSWTGNAWASTLDKVLIVLGALFFIVLLGVADFYLRKSREPRMIWGRFARLIGIEVLILFGLHAFIAIKTGFSAPAFSLLGTELILGMTAVGYSWQVLPPGTGKFSQHVSRLFKKT
jgi:hypothetical protein